MSCIKRASSSSRRAFGDGIAIAFASATPELAPSTDSFFSGNLFRRIVNVLREKFMSTRLWVFLASLSAIGKSGHQGSTHHDQLPPASLLVEPLSGLQTSEGGAPATFSVALASAAYQGWLADYASRV
jgi:hypothetical protein